MTADLKIKKIYWCGCLYFTSMGLLGGKGREVEKYVCVLLIAMLKCVTGEPRKFYFIE